MTRIALSTGSLYNYGAARVFELAAETGFDGVELMLDDRWDTRQPAYVQRLMRETSLPVTTVHNPFMPVVSGWPTDPVERLKLSAALACEIGVSVVVAHLPLRLAIARLQFLGVNLRGRMLPLPWPAEADYQRFLQQDLAQFEAEHGVVVGVENMPAKRLLGWAWSPYRLHKLAELATMPHLTLDTTHVGTWGMDPVAVYERLKARIVHVHLSNYDGLEHRRPEAGDLPLAELLERLARDGYAGTVTIELGPEVLEAEDEDRVRAHLRRGVEFCRKHLAAN